MGKIRFAIWNILGPTQKPSENPKKIPKWQQRVESILFDDALDVDFVFLQEIPDPLRTKLKDKDVFKDPTKKKFYDWHSGTANPEYFRGILFFQKNRKSSLHFEKYKDPVNSIGQGYSIYDGSTEIFRFTGFWNVRQMQEKNAATLPLQDEPKDEKQNQDYLSLLKKFLNRVIPEASPCVIAGDTNVCISSQGAKKMTGNVCEGIRKDLENFLSLHSCCLIDGKKEELNNLTYFRGNSGFRCDLLMASSCLIPHLTNLSVGFPENLKNCPVGSDHLPLFFSFNYADDSDNKD